MDGEWWWMVSEHREWCAWKEVGPRDIDDAFVLVPVGVVALLERVGFRPDLVTIGDNVVDVYFSHAGDRQVPSIARGVIQKLLVVGRTDEDALPREADVRLSVRRSVVIERTRKELLDRAVLAVDDARQLASSTHQKPLSAPDASLLARSGICERTNSGPNNSRTAVVFRMPCSP